MFLSAQTADSITLNTKGFDPQITQIYADKCKTESGIHLRKSADKIRTKTTH
jgi:hypothetical protein